MRERASEDREGGWTNRQSLGDRHRGTETARPSHRVKRALALLFFSSYCEETAKGTNTHIHGVGELVARKAGRRHTTNGPEELLLIVLDRLLLRPDTGRGFWIRNL